MDTRQLGKSDLRVSPFCFGGIVFGWTVDEKRSFVLLDADTADVYSLERG